MQDFNFILKHCDRTIKLYENVEKELVNKNLSPNSARWVQEELQRIKYLIQGYQEAEAEEMANYFNQ
ncbi:hypothetical protein H6G80_30560 [Nostoc sp. FACHB-87]|uniref:hypothetical protein n=1 Tax=Nostocaceae TaxID=1162 RepID=UPI0016860E95|nr:MULTISPECIES: hypothetical protein [Nostocaceae]MBD2458396.1 hypothetical protein [Nostoc sp. FACHB-87]MBD2479508.1 hypothetical protein [Anabaena sp. FACHB-83]